MSDKHIERFIYRLCCSKHKGVNSMEDKYGAHFGIGQRRNNAFSGLKTHLDLVEEFILVPNVRAYQKLGEIKEKSKLEIIGGYSMTRSLLEGCLGGCIGITDFMKMVREERNELHKYILKYMLGKTLAEKVTGYKLVEDTFIKNSSGPQTEPGKTDELPDLILAVGDITVNHLELETMAKQLVEAGKYGLVLEALEHVNKK